MGFLRSILWVPTVFGIIMGGLVITNVYVRGYEVYLVAFPGEIIKSYRQLSDYIFYNFIQNFLSVEISPYWQDFFALSLCGWISILRSLFTNSSAAMVFFREPINGLVYKLENVKKSTGILDFIFNTSALFYRAIVVVIAYAIILIQPLISVFALSTFLFIFTFRWLPILHYRISGRLGEIQDEEWYKNQFDFNLLFIPFVILMNFLVAALLLWWNAAEIERLTAGIG